MKFAQSLLLALSLLFSICVADLLEYVDKISTCALTCLSQTIPASECKTFTNSTCICNSASLLQSTDACMSTECTVLERLELANLNEKACKLPVQHRRVYDWIGMGILDAVGPIFFIARLYFRWAMTKKMEIDDWIMLATFIVWIPFTTLGIIIRVEAVGYNIWDLEVKTITRALKLFFIDELLYTLVLALLRIGILFFFMRVFAPLERWCWIVMAFVVSSATIVIFMTLFQCTPVSYNWEGWTGDYKGDFKCINVNVLSYAAAASGITQDLIILILPLHIIATLQMHMKKKIMTLLIFSLGIFILITSCIRLKSLVQFAKSLNPTWDYVDAVLWTSLEVNISVIVVCAPAIRIFLAQLLPKIFGSTINPSRKPASSGSHTHHSMPKRNEYTDLPDRSVSQGATTSWEQSSIELDGKVVEVTSTTTDADEGNTKLISSRPPLDDPERGHPRQVSWSVLNRDKPGPPSP